jgi:hypothetical protein
MKKKKGINIVGYGTNVALGGTTLSLVEQAGGTGTTMGVDYMKGMSKPIGTMANVQGTSMVLGSLKKLKMPMGMRKRRRR